VGGRFQKNLLQTGHALNSQPWVPDRQPKRKEDLAKNYASMAQETQKVGIKGAERAILKKTQASTGRLNCLF
jgi:hypothetical protein